jgi:hypothetical protein
MSTRKFSQKQKPDGTEPPTAPATSPEHKRAVSQLREEFARNAFSIQAIPGRATAAPKEIHEVFARRLDPYPRGGLNE